MEGAHRFLKRLWAFAPGARRRRARRRRRLRLSRRRRRRAQAARRELHVTLKQANYDYERIQYNTVVSAGMKMLNTLEALPADARGGAALLREGLSMLLRVLYPVVPHTTWVLWQDLGFAAEFGDLLDAPWPRSRCGGARAGRDRARAAGERQAARQARRAGGGGQRGDRGRRARAAPKSRSTRTARR